MAVDFGAIRGLAPPKFRALDSKPSIVLSVRRERLQRVQVLAQAREGVAGLLREQSRVHAVLRILDRCDQVGGTLASERTSSRHVRFGS
jgi:hypothetical protein